MGTFQNCLDTWSVSEETLAGYLQAAFCIRQRRGADQRVLTGVRYFDTNTLSEGYSQVATGSGASRVVTFPPVSQAWRIHRLAAVDQCAASSFTDKFVGRLTAGDVMARPNPSQMAFRRRSTERLIASHGYARQSGSAALRGTAIRRGVRVLPVRHQLRVRRHTSAPKYARFIINQLTRRDVNRRPPLQHHAAHQRHRQGDHRWLRSRADRWRSTSCRAHGRTLAWSQTRRSPTTRATRVSTMLTGEILPFPGVSDLSYNASLYYETEKFSVRTAYNWRESWLHHRQRPRRSAGVQ